MQIAGAGDVQVVERVSVELVSAVYPKAARTNVVANWPLVQAALKDFGIGDSKSLVIYTLATIRVETGTFSPDPEKPSKYSRTVDRAGYAGIQDPGTERPFGAYDSTIRTRKDGSAIVNKKLGNCFYAGKDEELMRARHGMPPNPDCEDGIRFRGRGFIQLTGRYNYEEMQRRIGAKAKVDIVTHPEDAASPELAARILAAFVFDHRKEIENCMKAKDFLGARRIVNKAGLGMDVFSRVIRDLDKRIPLVKR